MKTDHSEIVQRLRNKDEAAFKEVFEYYFDRLLFFVKEYVHDEEYAREIVQESFIKCWDKSTELLPNTNIGSYLFTISRNLSLNHLKHMAVRQRHSDESQQKFLENQLNYLALSETGEQILLFDELKSKIDVAIEELPEQCQRVFMMSRFEELKYKEIAEKLSISIKTVENHMGKALSTLRNKLKDYLYFTPILIFEAFRNFFT